MYSCGEAQVENADQMHQLFRQLGVERLLMERVAKLKLKYFGNVTRQSAGTMAVAEGSKYRPIISK